MSENVPIKTLLKTVLDSILQVVISCLAGYVLARAGVLDKPTQRKLNAVNVSLLTPALLFSKVAFSLTPEKLKEMWTIPIGFVIITAVSALVAWTLGKVFRLKKTQLAFAMCASMFQNSNSLPIALIQSLVSEVPGLKWGKDDNKDQMVGRALAYMVVYSTLGMMLRWSYGVKLLSSVDEEDEEDQPESIINQEAELTQEPESMDTAGTSAQPPGTETDPLLSSHDQLKGGPESPAYYGGRRFASPARSHQSSLAHVGSRGGSISAMSPTRSSQRGLSPGGRRLTAGSIRRPSTTSMHRRPSLLSRTESGREFLGLPQAGLSKADQRRQSQLESQQHYHRGVPCLSDHAEDSDEDSSADEHHQHNDEEDEEWGDTRRGRQSRGSLPFSRRRQAAVPPHTRLGHFMRRTKNKLLRIWKVISEFMTVPIYSSLLSVFIAVIPPLQNLLNQAQPLKSAIKATGQCSIPLTMIVLGAFFYTPPAPPSDSPSTSSSTTPNASVGKNKGNFIRRKFDDLVKPNGAHMNGTTKPSSPTAAAAAYPGENKTVFVAVVSRMFLVPLLLLPLIALMARYDYFTVAEDPVFVLACVLMISSPPALTLAQLTQAAKGDAFERLISKTITWSYAILTPPLTVVYVMLGLTFGRL